MTTSAISGFNAYTWLSQIQGTAPAPSKPAPTKPTSYAYPTPTVSNLLNVPSNIFSLMGGNGVGNSTGNAISTLFGNGSASPPSNPLAGVYNAMLYGSPSLPSASTATNAYTSALLTQTSPFLQSGLGLLV